MCSCFNTFFAKISALSNYEIRAKSTFIIDKFGLRSKHYRNFERDGDKIKKDFNIRPTGRQVDSLAV
jgi:hypothetical protein